MKSLDFDRQKKDSNMIFFAENLDERASTAMRLITLCCFGGHTNKTGRQVADGVFNNYSNAGQKKPFFAPHLVTLSTRHA